MKQAEAWEKLTNLLDGVDAEEVTFDLGWK